MSDYFPTFRRIGKGLFPTLRRIGKGLFSTLRRIGKGLFPTFRRIGKVLLVLIVVLAVVHGVATLILGRRVEAKIEAIKARGEPVSMAELGLPKVPDAENAAVIYAKAFELISTPEADEDLGVLARFANCKDRDKEPALWAQAREIMPRYRNVLVLVEEAAARPTCRFPVKWEDGPGAVFPHCAKLRKLAQLLRAHALLDARDGRMNEAWRSVELGFKVSEALKDEPAPVAMLVRVAIIAIAARGIEDTLDYGNISETQAKHLFDSLAEIDLVPGCVKAMQGERAYGLWAFDHVRRHPREFAGLIGGTRASDLSLWAVLPGSYLWRPFLYADELAYVGHMNKAVNGAHLTSLEIKSKNLDLLADPDLPWYAAVSSIVLPILDRARTRRDDASAEIAGSQIVLALQVYKHRQGSYPRTLDELRAKLGWEIPTDIFSGEDFVYKPQGKGFLLYSIGENLKDDGARVYPSALGPVPPEGGQREEHPYRTSDGWSSDIVWQMDH